MPSSSEEEIIKRRRTNISSSKKKDLRNLFDEDSSTSSVEYVPESAVQDNFFFELFGTGKEYFYIFDTHKLEEEKEEEMKENCINLQNLIEYTQRYFYDELPAYNENIPKICDLFLKGYNIYYIFLYETESLDFYQYINICIKMFEYQNLNTSINIVNKNNNFSLTKFDKNIFDLFFDRIYNGSVNLNKDDKIFSITKEKNIIKGVILDCFGNIIDKFSFLDNKIVSFVEEINPKYIFISGYNNLVRSVVQLLIKYKVFYMESKFFKEMGVYERLCHVGRLGIFPEVEFINIYYFPYTESYINNIENNEESRNLLRLAISTVISTTKLKIDFLLQYENKLKLLEFLGLGNCTRIFENDNYENEEDIKKVLKDEILYKNFMTYFSINKVNSRPNFTGFPDSFVFRELINIKINCVEDLINKEVEGKIFFVDEFYVLVNILNNITCYVRSTDKYYLNQMVKLRIIEINEPFLSFTGEIISIHKNIQKMIKHPLLVNLNDKETQNKLKNSNEYFLLRQSSKDSKIIIYLKIYKNIISHIKLETCDNLDESVNKKLKNILRNVSQIKNNKYFYEDEDEATSKISEYCEFIKYGFYFSEEYPGRLCFMYNNKGISKEYLSVDEKLIYKGKEFDNLEEFIKYRKRV